MSAHPNIVLVHGAWADGSSWSAVIERCRPIGLQRDRASVPGDLLADDVARLRHVLARQVGRRSSPGTRRRADHDRARRRRAERRRAGVHRRLRAR